MACKVFPHLGLSLSPCSPHTSGTVGPPPAPCSHTALSAHHTDRSATLSCHSCKVCSPPDQSPSGGGHRHHNAGLQCQDDSDRPRFSGHTRCSSCQWGRNCRGRTRRHCGCSSSLACTRCTGGQPRSPGTSTSRPLDGSSLLSSLARDTGMAGILIHLWHFHSSPQYIHDTPSLLYVQCTSGTPQCCDHNCLVC